MRHSSSPVLNCLWTVAGPSDAWHQPKPQLVAQRSLDLSTPATTRQILFGCDEPAEETLTLRAGSLHLRLRGAKLLQVQCEGRVVWHGLNFVYRDENWATPQPVVLQRSHTSHAGGFSLSLTMGYPPPDESADLRSAAAALAPAGPPLNVALRITGTADGTLRYEAVAIAEAELVTNRTGLCLMHPVQAAGQAVSVTHADGRCSRSTFPREIAPWPPFMSVQAIAHEWTSGRWAEARLEGDVFELEDQRNNADASFKTYSRSNLMPRPYTMSAGQTIRQAITLRLLPYPAAQIALGAPAEKTVHAAARPPTSAPASISASVAIPSAQTLAHGLNIGVGLTAADTFANAVLLQRLQDLRPRFLHLHLGSVHEPVNWSGLALVLKACRANLRIDLALPPPVNHPALATLAAALHAAGVRAEAVAVFPSTPEAVTAVKNVWGGPAEGAAAAPRVGGGTLHFFTQLNRSEHLGPLDFVSFTTSALVHGVDDEEIIEGLQSLPFMLDTLAVKFPGHAVRVGPSAIAARASPLGAQPESDGQRRVALAKRDPRSRGLFGAAWLVGYVCALADRPVEALTLMQVQGDSGLLQGHDARPVPAYFALQELLTGHTLKPLTGLPAGVCGVQLDPGNSAKPRLLLANLRAYAIRLETSALGNSACDWRMMDETSLRAQSDAPWRCVLAVAGSSPLALELSPYAVLRVHP